MSTASDVPAEQSKLVYALLDPRRYPHAVQSVQLIETHISWVLLAGEFAYKIKKALDLGFLDYTTLAQRRFCCDEELRLNRRTAPDIYLDCVAIGGSPEAPRFDAQPAIEYAVRMRRFDPASLMDEQLRLGKVTYRHIDALAAAIVRFHTGLPAAATMTNFGSAESVGAAAMHNFEPLHAHLTGAVDRRRIAALQAATEAERAACRDLFEQRTQGRVRECHGDLHLGNIVLLDDEPVPFDCIEFNPDLRWIDTMSEIAFTVMDLLHRGQPEFAWRLLNACLEADGDYAGIPVLRFYLAYRAAVRAKVCAIRIGQGDLPARARQEELAACRSYLDLGQQCLTRRQAGLIITHGLPGSGKTTFSQLALQRLGAIRIRSDVERKRLFGLGALDDSHARVGDIYTADATARTYAHLLATAHTLLAAGYPVIVDAAFLRRDERQAFRELAQTLGVPYAIATLQAEDAVLRVRLSERRGDASEADAAVLEKLQAVQELLTPDELACAAGFDTGQPPDLGPNRYGWHRLAGLLGILPSALVGA